MNFWNQKFTGIDCTGWGKDSVSLTQIVWSYFLKGKGPK